ncbi:tripartite tricarboxylate transporter TctB family protein [Actinomycetospora termitidis]|uniref:Tripartite tricarboxylate transporter TctB family protein n=1 Tax=Actinomycetospora termitidis TaxID=3053470 RepID=A0ABT7M4L2_9PSEU|nr:tripartite tricarboxylate transporter TctB family protein [Actinomycetospora sp. Odt1-22]MDL5155618.1 tripartite tricarboxylate transporter TctB family protein [Actinomycetospora sp. Odt1-22]
MTTGVEPARRSWWSEHAELGVAALLAVVGVLVAVDTVAEGTLSAGSDSDPIGPGVVPLVLSAALVVLAALLTVDVLRGGHGEAEAGEDVDLETPMDLRTVGMLAGVLIATAALIPVLGWPIAGTVLFAGAAHALGSRRLEVDIAVAATVSLATWVVFDSLLGVDLPGGPLMGVLG